MATGVATGLTPSIAAQYRLKAAVEFFWGILSHRLQN
jgi:hypothetical protein